MATIFTATELSKENLNGGFVAKEEGGHTYKQPSVQDGCFQAVLAQAITGKILRFLKVDDCIFINSTPLFAML